MPIYEYDCERCGERFELLCKAGDFSDKPCPKCGQPSKKLPASGIGLVFKGDGFYVNDYGKGKSPKSASKSDEKPPACKACEHNKSCE